MRTWNNCKLGILLRLEVMVNMLTFKYSLVCTCFLFLPSRLFSWPSLSHLSLSLSLSTSLLENLFARFNSFTLSRISERMRNRIEKEDISCHSLSLMVDMVLRDHMPTLTQRQFMNQIDTEDLLYFRLFWLHLFNVRIA